MVKPEATTTHGKPISKYVQTKYRQEVNVPQAGIEEVVPDRLFRVLGFDIGSSNLDKSSNVKSDLDKIIRYLKDVDDASPTVTIIGIESQSRLRGAEFKYGWARARAIEKYFRDHRVPATMTVTSHGAIYAPPSESPPEVKAYWRAATIEIVLSGKPKSGPTYRGGFPPDVPPRPKVHFVRNMLFPPPLSPEGVLRKLATQIVVGGARELHWANVAGAIQGCRNEYYMAHADALAHLAEADPANRLVDVYKNLPQGDLYEICGAMTTTPVGKYPRAFMELVDLVRSTGRHNAVDWVASMGQSGYETWAREWRQRYPDFDDRRKAFGIC